MGLLIAEEVVLNEESDVDLHTADTLDKLLHDAWPSHTRDVDPGDFEGVQAPCLKPPSYLQHLSLPC